MRGVWLSDHRWLNLDNVIEVRGDDTHVAVRVVGGDAVHVVGSEATALWQELRGAQEHREALREAFLARMLHGEDGR